MSKYTRIGPAFMWFRSSKKANGRPKLFSSYTTEAEPSDPILTNFGWPANGLFLGQTMKGTNVDFDPKFTQTDESVGLINVPTDSFLDNQSADISASLAYNGVDEIADLFWLPENNANGIRSNTRSSKGYEGSLLIGSSNIRNSDQQYHHIVRWIFIKRVQAIPGKLSIGEGHAPILARFKILAAKNISGCYESSDYLRWTSSLYDPNTILTGNGNIPSAGPQFIYPLSPQWFVNL